MEDHSDKLIGEFSDKGQPYSNNAEVCGETPCEYTEIFPQSLMYGSCAFVAVLSLVRQTPCLLKHLERVNKGAHDAIMRMDRLLFHEPGDLESMVCPYMPQEVWDMYANLAGDDDSDFLPEYTWAQSFYHNVDKLGAWLSGRPTMREIFKRGFRIGLFVRALFEDSVNEEGGDEKDTSNPMFVQYVQYDFMPKIMLFENNDPVRKAIKDAKDGKITKAELRTVMKLHEDETKPVGIKVSSDFYNKIKEVFKSFKSKFEDHEVVYNFVVSAEDPNNPDGHAVHALFGTYCKSTDVVSLCTWGKCYQSNRFTEVEEVDQITYYHLTETFLFGIPKQGE